MKNNVKQFINLKDQAGSLKNISELLDEIRNKNIKALWLGFVRNDESVRTYWFGYNDIPKLNLLLDTMKRDFLDNRFEDYDVETYE